MSAGDWKERGRKGEMCCGCGRWGHEQVAAQDGGGGQKAMDRYCRPGLRDHDHETLLGTGERAVLNGLGRPRRDGIERVI